jgi:hypothetical protein
LVRDVYRDRLTDVEKLRVLLSGDGRRTGNKRHNFLVVIGILDIGLDIRSPKHRFTAILTPDGETYAELELILPDLDKEIADLQKRGLDVEGVIWEVEFHLCADWKLLNTVTGLAAAHANIFCPWCLQSKDERRGVSNGNAKPRTDNIWHLVTCGSEADRRKYGHKHQPLLPSIPPSRVWLDPLHLLLRAGDTLQGLLLEDVSAIYATDKGVVDRLEAAATQAGAHFRLEVTDDGLRWPTLTGDGKVALLTSLDLTGVLPEARAVATRELWTEFMELFKVATAPVIYSSATIDGVARQASAWVHSFITPSSKNARQTGFERGMYANARVTPYLHALVAHLPDQLRRATNLNIPYGLVTCEPVEKKHHLQVQDFYRGTAHGGGRGRPSPNLQLFRKEARSTLYMAKNQSPVAPKERTVRSSPRSRSVAGKAQFASCA